MRALALAILFSAAGPLAAEPFLDLPIACTIGTDCFIEDYVDVDPGPGAVDHACGLKARDGHRGTDFALPDMAALQTGVAVLAASDGTVAAVRDSEPDVLFARGRDLGGRDCGNAVRIAHPNGTMTLYCHLARGSVAVTPGDQVLAGDPLGRVGLSGMTNFPHLHFTVLASDGSEIDPFHPTAAIEGCDAQAKPLWNDPPPYTRTGFFTVGFSTGTPTLATVQDGSARATVAAPDAPLVLYAHLFHAETGDVLAVSAQGPGGTVFSRRVRVEEGRPNLFRAIGRRAPDAGWPVGDYVGQITLTRGGTLLGARQARISVQAPERGVAGR